MKFRFYFLYSEQGGNYGYYLQVEQMVIKIFEDDHGEDIGQRLREFFDPDIADSSEDAKHVSKKRAELKARAKGAYDTDPLEEDAFDSVNRRMAIYERWVSFIFLCFCHASPKEHLYEKTLISLWYFGP